MKLNKSLILGAALSLAVVFPAFAQVGPGPPPNGKPTGAAGGDLCQSYPNPQVCSVANVASGLTGTGALVQATSPTLVTPNIGAATGTSLNISSGSIILASSGLGSVNAGLTIPSNLAVITLGSGSDVSIGRGGVATLQLGGINAASPVAQTLQAQGSRGGTDTNTAGANLTEQCGDGTGNATGCTYTFKTSHAGSTGATQQTMNSQIVLGDNTVAMPNLASSSAGTTGTLCWTTGTGNVNVDTTTTCLLSSYRYKMNAKPLDVGLDEISKLKPISYDLKPEFNPKHLGRQIGLGAEDVAKVDDRLVSHLDDGRVNSVRYQQLTAVLVKGEQELLARVVALEKRNAALESQLRHQRH